MEEKKLCPLKKATESDLMMFQNIDITPEDLECICESMKKGIMGAIKASSTDAPLYVGPIMGVCDGERCGWWSIAGQCCNMAYLLAIAMGVSEKGENL